MRQKSLEARIRELVSIHGSRTRSNLGTP